MKTKFIALSLAAAALVFASCQKEEKNVLSEVQVSSSYITFGADGGTTKITVTAQGDWTLNPTIQIDSTYYDDVKGKTVVKVDTVQLKIAANNWFEVSPQSGKAGVTEVVFTAPKATGNHESNIKLVIGDKAQNLIVKQTAAAEEVKESTVAEINAGADGTVFRVTGTCTSIASTTYGNWYLKDAEGKTVYVYGTVDASGSYNWSALNIAVGDKVTVQGPKTTYGSTVELVDVSVIKVEKALILCDLTTMYLTKEEQEISIPLTVKGSSLVNVSNADWIVFDPGYTTDKNGHTVFKAKVAANTTGKTRQGNLVFTSEKGTSSTEFTLAVEQIGSDAKDFGLLGVAAAISVSTSSKNPVNFDVNLKDAVVTYKNGSNIFIEDATGGLLIYSSDVKLNVGDVVNGRVYGSGYGYNNLPEATSFNMAFAKVENKEAPKPTEVTLADLIANYASYLSRYIVIKGVKVSEAIDITYNKLTSAGKLTDGTNTIAIQAQSSGKFNNNKLYFYLNCPVGTELDITTIPGIYKTTQQLNLWNAEQIALLNKE